MDGNSYTAWIENAEEEFPQKCSRSLDKAHKQARRRTMNKISKRFGEQLNVSANEDTSALSRYLRNAYNAKSFNSSSLQHPVSISQLDRMNVSQHVIIEPNTGQLPSSFDPDMELEPDRKVCFGVSMEKLSTAQELREVDDWVCPRSWKHVITVQPLAKSIQLHFNGIRKFEKSIDDLIDQHLGGSVSKLYVKNLSQTDKHYHGAAFRRTTFAYVNGGNCLGPRTIFDEEDHVLLLIPAFTKSGFTSFDMREEFSFPFHVDFNVDGQKLPHDFRMPLLFSHQPQRFRLKFMFRPPNYDYQEEITVFSYFTVFCIVPTLPTPTISASVQVFKVPDSDHATSDEKTHRFVKTILGSAENAALWNAETGGKYNIIGMPRVHCKSVHVEGMTADGFKVGYNFLYEVPPKPKYRCNPDRRLGKETKIKRREIVKNIRSDLGDC